MVKPRFRICRVVLIFLSLCLFILPNIVDNVFAAEPITLEDWESYNLGVTSGTGDYIVWSSWDAGGQGQITTGARSGQCVYFHGNPNPTTLYVNFTNTYPYIYSISIWIEGGGSMSPAILYYNGTDTVASVYYEIGEGFYYEPVDSGAVKFSTAGSQEDGWLNVTHVSNNLMNYSWYNSGDGSTDSGEGASAVTETWTNISRLKVTSGTSEFRIDDIIINNTYTGPSDDIPNGYLGVNCFNETGGENITEFNVLFINQEGETFYNYGVDNTYIIWSNILPQGNTLLTVSKTGYYSRTYELDIEDGYFVFDDEYYNSIIINAYLPSINLSNLYYIQVIDEYLNPVEDVQVKILGFVGESEYQDVSLTFTDGYGFTNAYLCWGKEYLVTISKEDYVTRTDSWIPDPSNYGIEYPKVFKITSIQSTGEPIEDLKQESMILSANNSTHMRIDYLYKGYNNSFVNFTIYDLIGDTLLASYNISDDPNNISIAFNFSAYDLDGDILKVVANAYRIDGASNTLTRYFNIAQASRSISASAAISVIFSISICLFGLTIAHPKKTLGPIGIVVIIIAIAVTAFCEQTWYIHLIQSIEIILLIFILLVFKEEGIHAI